VGTPRALRHREGLREVQGSVANTAMGTTPAHGRWRVAVHGSAVAQFYSGEQLRTIEGKQGKIGAGVVGVLGPTAHPGLPLKVFLGVGRCQRL
jgi:hypothetical protein